MYKVVKNPLSLSDESTLEFIGIFCSGNYEIVTTIPSADNFPESLIADYKDPETYVRIFDDSAAYYHFFSIRYTSGLNEQILVPIGLYGVSEDKQLRFPLVLNGFWQTFVMSKKEEFVYLYRLRGDEDIDDIYPRFIDLRKTFMRNIFKYYMEVDMKFSSVMAWGIRGTKSNTRKIAESLSFHRIEDGQTEIYSSKVLDSTTERHVKDCILRWGILVDDGKQGASNEVYPLRKIELFINGIVDAISV